MSEQIRVLNATITIRAMKENYWNGCPCLYTTPCHPDCTCVKPFSSVWCARCCTYGSEEQKKVKAQQLAELIDQNTKPTENK